MVGHLLWEQVREGSILFSPTNTEAIWLDEDAVLKTVGPDKPWGFEALRFRIGT